MTAIFVAITPLAEAPLARLEWFIPLYKGAIVVSAALSAALFGALFHTRGGLGLLALTAGWAYAALLTAAHLFSFPGLIDNAEVVAGPDTTAWLYMFWHLGAPLATLFYALTKRVVPGRERVLSGLAAAAGAAVVLSGDGHPTLPLLMAGDHPLPSARYAALGLVVLSCASIVPLFARRRRLDLWLGLGMYAWILEVALSSLISAGRFDLGWYCGRVFGLLAASLVLIEVLGLTFLGRRW